MEKEKRADNKINRRTFLKIVSIESGHPKETVEEVYDAMENVAKKIISSGQELFLIGFGSFFLSRHKRHPVRYNASSKDVGDYIVFKFSPSNVFVKKLREEDKKSRIQTIADKKAESDG